MSDNATKPRIWWGIERGQYPDFFNSLVECENYKQNCERSDEVGYQIINVIEKKAYDELIVHFKALSIVCDDLIPENSSLQKQLDKAKAEITELNEILNGVTDASYELEAENTRLRNEMKNASDHCLCSRNVKGFDYHEEHKKLGFPKSGSRWLTPVDIIKIALKQEGEGK